MALEDFQHQFDTRLAWLSTLYLVLFGAANWSWLRATGVEVTPLVTLICCLPATLSAALAFTSRADPEQYRLRLMACALMTPILLLFWSTSADPLPSAAPRAIWPFATAAALIHVAAFVGLIYWGGSASTRVAARPGTTPEPPKLCCHACCPSMAPLRRSP